MIVDAETSTVSPFPDETRKPASTPRHRPNTTYNLPTIGKPRMKHDDVIGLKSSTSTSTSSSATSDEHVTTRPLQSHRESTCLTSRASRSDSATNADDVTEMTSPRRVATVAKPLLLDIAQFEPFSVKDARLKTIPVVTSPRAPTQQQRPSHNATGNRRVSDVSTPRVVKPTKHAPSLHRDTSAMTFGISGAADRSRTSGKIVAHDPTGNRTSRSERFEAFARGRKLTLPSISLTRKTGHHQTT